MIQGNQPIIIQKSFFSLKKNWIFEEKTFEKFFSATNFKIKIMTATAKTTKETVDNDDDICDAKRKN